MQFFTLAPHWDRICRLIERPDLIDDPFFTAPENFTGNAEAKAMFDALLIEWCVQHTKREVMERSQAEGYMCGADQHDRGRVQRCPPRRTATSSPKSTTRTPDRCKYPGAQFKMSETPWRAGRAPLLGEHTQEVLTQRLGYSEDDVVKLRAQGAI